VFANVLELKQTICYDYFEVVKEVSK